MEGTGGHPFQGLVNMAEKPVVEGAKGHPSQGMATHTVIQGASRYPFQS